MLYKLIKSLLVTTLLFALQTGGVANVHSRSGKQQTAEKQGADIRQSIPHNQLVAEAGAEINLPVLQLNLHTAAFLPTDNLARSTAGLSLYKGRASTVPESRFYRLILFPFHGFW